MHVKHDDVNWLSFQQETVPFYLSSKRRCPSLIVRTLFAYRALFFVVYIFVLLYPSLNYHTKHTDKRKLYSDS